MKGMVLIQVACLLCSVFAVIYSAPFKKETQITEEKELKGFPPEVTATRHLAEGELPGKEVSTFREIESKFPTLETQREFIETNGEEFFRRLERELAMDEIAKGESMSKWENTKEGDLELRRSGGERRKNEIPEKMFEREDDDVKNVAIDEELKPFHGNLKRELEEILAREMVEEANKRDLPEIEEEMELMKPERMYDRELIENSEGISDKELKTELKEEKLKHKREPSEEKNEIGEGKEHRKSVRNYKEEHEEIPALKQKREEEEKEEEKAVKTRELNFRTMYSDENAGNVLERDEDKRARASEERNWREREGEWERERSDDHGNKQRERKELRERQRVRALKNGRMVHEKEMEGRRQRQTIGSHGTRQEGERFRFRARGN